MKTLTEQAFAQALKEIMAKKSFDKITVTELVQHLKVNRQTFYYHFNDLYDLLEQIYISDGERMIGDNRTNDSWEKGMLALFHYIQDNKAFVCNTYYSVNRNYLEHFLYDRAYDLIKPVLEAIQSTLVKVVSTVSSCHLKAIECLGALAVLPNELEYSISLNDNTKPSLGIS